MLQTPYHRWAASLRHTHARNGNRCGIRRQRLERTCLERLYTPRTSSSMRSARSIADEPDASSQTAVLVHFQFAARAARCCMIIGLTAARGCEVASKLCDVELLRIAVYAPQKRAVSVSRNQRKTSRHPALEPSDHRFVLLFGGEPCKLCDSVAPLRKVEIIGYKPRHH